MITSAMTSTVEAAAIVACGSRRQMNLCSG
jgi:hypothetical protein